MFENKKKHVFLTCFFPILIISCQCQTLGEALKLNLDFYLSYMLHWSSWQLPGGGGTWYQVYTAGLCVPKIGGRGVFFAHTLRNPCGANRHGVFRQEGKAPPKAYEFAQKFCHALTQKVSSLTLCCCHLVICSFGRTFNLTFEEIPSPLAPYRNPPQ